jgi:uncharacterized protein (TIGR02217 family)
MTFHNVRLPIEVERGAHGGPHFRTNVTTLASGLELRNAMWTRSRGSWEVAYGVQSTNATDSNFNEVVDFFYARQGMLHDFRFRDWSDYKIDPAQVIGVGNGAISTFRIIRKYTSGPSTYERRITRPTQSTLVVTVNGVSKTLGVDYTENLGVLVFSVPPPAGHNVAVACEFDVPVRFDTDHLGIVTHIAGVMSIPSLIITEVKEDA